jgi:hypothetical protein
MADRRRAIHKTLSLLPSLYPQLANVMSSVQRYFEDVAAQLRRSEDDTAEALRQQERRLYAEFETFFEGKIRELVVARQKAEARAEAEHAAALTVRKERDSELVEVKEEILQRLNECEHTEEQFRDFRHLIASVFQTNQQLTLRIDQLESVLSRHRIDIPPASEEVSAYKTSSEAKAAGNGRSSNGDNSGPSSSTEVRSLSTQVPVEFMAVANKELVKSRLTLQKELLHSAFDDHSAYRLRIEGLTRQNQDLAFHITELEEKVRELHTYIHQKRFITRVDENGEETMPLTPRPREVPLALQTELGIELRHSTANILTELAIVAINMKHQLNSALLRARQLHAFASWLHEADSAMDSSSTGAGVMGVMLQQVTEAAVIPVFPVASWPSIPHFLRTNVSPEVRNCFWTEAQTACILYNFFISYKATRARARFVRDSKMLAPRVYQLFEYRRILLTRLDASKEDAALSEDRIPFGYVVTQFAREVLTQLSPKNSHDALPLVLPGTIATRYPLNPPAKAALAAQSTFTTAPKAGAAAADRKQPVGDNMSVEECEWTEAAPVVELDWTHFTYNMWYAAMRYQATQPLCQLFVDLVDGRLPLETFDVMERVLARVQRLVDQLDNDRSRRFSYPRLVNGVVRWVNDSGAQAVVRGVQAVVQSFESNHTPAHGGVIGPLALFADETYCDRQEVPALVSSEATARQHGSSLVPVNTTAATKAAAGVREGTRTALPGSLIVRQLPTPTIAATASPALALPPLGATVFVRYWRNYVRDALEGVYTRIEAVLAPLVEESEVVVGLYLLSVPRAKAVLAELDHLERQAAPCSTTFGGTGSDGGASAFGLAGQNAEDALTGAKLVAEAADLLGVHGVARSFLSLLESRKWALQEKNTTAQQVATETVMKAVGQLPRFKLSAHFPFHVQRQQAAAAAELRLNSGEAGEDEDAAEEETAPVHLQSPLAAPSLTTPNETPLSQKASTTGGSRPNKKVDRSQRRNAKKSLAIRVVIPVDVKSNPPVNSPKRQDSHLSGQRQKKGEQQRPPKASRSKTGGAVSNRDSTSESVEAELVEWYSLRHVLRQIMPDFPFLLFQPDAHEREEAVATLAKVSVLRAFEESPPTATAEE